VSDRLTSDVVAKVARLARLDLTEAEIEAATEQLGKMLDHFAEIDALDLSDVEPMNQPYPLVNVLRDDVELEFQPSVDPGRRLYTVRWTPSERTRVAESARAARGDWARACPVVVRQMMPATMRMMPIMPAGFMKSRPLYPASAGHEIDNQHHDREHEQDVNESTHRVRANEAQKPQHQQNNEYCPQHNFPPV